MAKKIMDGVMLNVIPTEKFKTTQILVRFRSPLTYEKLNRRSLLSAVMENGCQKCPSPMEMSEKLADMYGAVYSVDANRQGTEHTFSITFNIVNDHYLSEDTHILKETFELLEEVLFHPNVDNECFDPMVVQRERLHLMDYMQAAMEDKQDYAVMRLQSLMFKDHAQAAPYYGTLKGIQEVTADELYREYKEMLMNDAVEIIVVGDVTEEEILQYVTPLPFTPRLVTQSSLFYHQSLDEDILEEVETQALTQSKLALGYQTDTYFGESQYGALLVFNGLFGGFPHSKLFMNVREKESLAYYASSHIDAYRGMMLVQAGIERENKEFVIQLVQKQLHDLQMGDFDDVAFEQTKAMLMNQYLSGFDQPRAMVERGSRELRFRGLDLSEKAYIQRLEAVTREDVMQVARRVQLQSIYFLEGGQA